MLGWAHSLAPALFWGVIAGPIRTNHACSYSNNRKLWKIHWKCQISEKQVLWMPLFGNRESDDYVVCAIDEWMYHFAIIDYNTHKENVMEEASKNRLNRYTLAYKRSIAKPYRSIESNDRLSLSTISKQSLSNNNF